MEIGDTIGYRVKVLDENGLKLLHHRDFSVDDYMNTTLDHATRITRKQARDYAAKMGKDHPDAVVEVVRLALDVVERLVRQRGPHS